MFISDILTSSDKYQSGIVRLTIPKADGSGFYSDPIVGLIENDISFKLGTTWGSIIPNMSSLSEFTQIIDSQNIFSWVSSSTAAWKGTEPFQFDLTFYLVTYKYKQTPSILTQVERLASLCALYADKDNFATVKVHGGYKMHLADANNSGTNSTGRSYFTSGDLKNMSPVDLATKVYETGSEGLIVMELGNFMRIPKLLINNMTFTPSSVQVEDKVPLYVKVDASFRTHRALLVKDIEYMFGG